MLTRHTAVCTCCIRWTCDSNWEPAGTAKPFNNDYKSQRVYKNVPVTQIMIMRHKVRRQRPKPAHCWAATAAVHVFRGSGGHAHVAHASVACTALHTRNAKEVCDYGITIARACNAEDART